MSREKRQRHEAEDELYGFLRQSRISERNVARIKVLTRHADAKVKALAEIVRAIAGVKPHQRRRIRVIAERHGDLFARMVALLEDEFWDEFFARGEPSDWLWDRWASAKVEAQFQSHGRSPCWCGSGRPYWHCCATRDEALAEQFADERRGREWALNPAAIPWWHPASGVDPLTRSAYEMFYIDPDHPLAMTPP